MGATSSGFGGCSLSSFGDYKIVQSIDYGCYKMVFSGFERSVEIRLCGFETIFLSLYVAVLKNLSALLVVLALVFNDLTMVL